MAAENNNLGTNPSSSYTSFEQFIAQNNFCQLNNGLFHPNPSQPPFYPGNSHHHQQPPSSNAYDYDNTPSNYYFPKSTLTPTAEEFVPRDFTSQVFCNTNFVNGSQNNGQYLEPSVSELPISNLNLNGTSEECSPVSDDRPTTGAVPKQSKLLRNNYRENGIRSHREYDNYRNRSEGKFRGNGGRESASNHPNPNYERHNRRRADYDENRDYYQDNNQRNQSRYKGNKPQNEWSSRDAEEASFSFSDQRPPPPNQSCFHKGSKTPDWDRESQESQHQSFDQQRPTNQSRYSNKNKNDSQLDWDRDDYSNLGDQRPSNQSRYSRNSRNSQNDWDREESSSDQQRPSNLESSRINRKKAQNQNHPEFKANRNLKKPQTPFVMPIDISQREKLVVEIDSGKLECLVCCENIKPFQSCWCCRNCYHILHLNCTIKWAQSSKGEDGWRCPACQNVSVDVPRDYFCFCGKLKNPQYNRNDVAHSCGELCGRFNGCDHPCTLLCHPGACPTCQASVTRSCGCGKSSRMMQCNQNEDIICEGECEKMRNCGVHKCLEKCHTGACKDCPETVEHVCHCGKNKKQAECTVENLENVKYCCTKNCNKRLNCGNHKCQKTCHDGECGDCRLAADLIKFCPCGKRSLLPDERKSCLDAIPLCGSVCGKPLKCGSPAHPHPCISKCHTGSCPPCNKQTAVKCRCGHMDQMIKCRQLTSRADDARCKKKCTKKRNCGKHRCNLECCIDIDHICPLPCPSTLSCGKHKCDKTCHPGHCLPCLRSTFQELQCECGAQIIYPPVPCGTKKPVCDKPCRRQHVCDHEVLHNCHTAPNCPPCMLQTTKQCFGKHEQRKTIPCSQESFCCGMPCNKELPCKRHKCIKTCHEGGCVAEGETCKQNCPKIRVVCAHKCNSPCHDGDCPDTVGLRFVRVLKDD